jgi:metallo-beta-lactamase class B
MMITGVLANASGANAAIQRVKLNNDVEFQQLTEHVWLHTTFIDYPGYGRIPANGLIVVSGATAAMIDTPWNGEQTGAVFDWVAQEFNATIDHVIVGHAHDDCMGGLAKAHQRGAASYALDLTVEKARQGNLPIPQHTFSDSMTVTVGDMKLVLRYFGGGHTEDNIVVWIPAEKVLFGGCLIKAANAKNLGNTREADLQSWPETVQKVIDTFPDADIVVPGHGRHGGTELLTHTLSLAEHD